MKVLELSDSHKKTEEVKLVRMSSQKRKMFKGEDPNGLDGSQKGRGASKKSSK